MGDLMSVMAPGVGSKSTSTYGVGSAVSTMPASQMGHPSPSVKARTNSLSPSECKFTLTAAQPETIGGWMFAGHTLTDAARYRVRMANLAVSDPTGVAPTAIEASTNYTGVVGDVDEDPDSAVDANWLEATVDGTATSVRLSFGSPGGNLDTTDKAQLFRIAARLSIASPPAPRVLTVKLYESGAEVETLATLSVTANSSTYEIFEVEWAASSLSDVSGADVELVLEGAAASGTSIDIGAVYWWADVAPGGGYAYDSEWTAIPTYDDATLWSNAAPFGDVVAREVWGVLSTAVTAGHIRVDFRDFDNSSSYIDLGLLEFGPVHNMDYDMDVGSGIEFIAGVDEGSEESFAGVSLPITRYAKRSYPTSHTADETEAISVIDRLIYRGLRQPVMVVFDRRSQGRHKSLWAVPSLTSPLSYTGGIYDSGDFEVTWAMRWSEQR